MLDIIPIALSVLILVLLFLMRRQFAAIKTNQDRQDEVDTLREEISRSERDIKDEVKSSQRTISETVTTQLESTGKILTELGKAQNRELENMTKSTNTLTQSNEDRIENVRKTVDDKLQNMQEDLRSILGLTSDVANLRKVLTDVNIRGAWGEAQLEAILKQILAPDQYESQVRLRTGYESVDYAVRFPGNEPNTPVLLPIDSKFPIADYERFLDAIEKSDEKKKQSATKNLIKTVRENAKSISKKYILSPTTTELAIMFLPIEGLYLEVLRQPGEAAELLQKYKIIVAGPTTLAAILMSLLVGFKTLAFQEGSNEIRNILEGVNTEFKGYHEGLRKARNQLNNASDNLEKASKHSEEIMRKLQNLENLSPTEAAERPEIPDTQLAGELKQ